MILTTITTAALLLAAPQGGDDENNGWSGAANAGVTWITGNSEAVTSTVDVTTKYENGGYRWIFEGNYSGVRNTDQTTGDASTSSRLYRLAAEHHRFLDSEENLYMYGKGSARSDKPIGLDIREDAGVGLGYTWRWDEDKSQVSVEGGPSYLIENNVGALKQDFLAARAGARLDSQLAEDWKLLGRAEYFNSLDNTEDRSFTGELSLRWNFEESWFAQATAANAWDNTPGPGLKKTDWRFVVSIGTTF